MDGQGFVRVVRDAFLPFLRDLGFQINPPLISGKFYRVSFEGRNNIISIYYEPGEGFLLILVFALENGRPSDIDDRSKTLRLTDLTRRYMPLITKAERAINESAFGLVRVHDEEEKLLLKRAKELRLVLPLYLAKR